ncbi:MAG: S1-like domain-containing RNA-binding protein [Muribaculaceae bacterium]|nr:S1-like domain-containing RNA-binding protein [Muribaculaceae bacterium]
MIKIGKYQDMVIRRMVDFGAYLSPEGCEQEVLLPGRYLPENAGVGDMFNVFVYTDSEDRPVATTERPYATVGEFAFLEVTAVNDTGAFLDWGLPKDLLVPYSEQKIKMRRGGIYLVYVYLDDASGRPTASAKIEKYLGNVFPDYRPGAKVQALVYEHTPIGYKVIVDNLHRGIIYSNEIFRPIELEESVTAFVKQVRDDGKIDLTLNDVAVRRQTALADRILEYIACPDAKPIGDKSSPELIELIFSCSKKDFKKAVGHLYRDRKIAITADGFIVKV